MLYIYSIIAGALIGFAVSVGAARMFKAPEVQALGAFRTLGEINACKGDALSHFSFGLGFFLNSAAAAAGTGALTQDVAHRIIPNWAAAIITFRKKKDKMQLLGNPLRMGIAGMLAGILVVPLLVGANQMIPSEIAGVAKAVLKPATKWLFAYIMPAIFLLAAINAGKHQALFAIIFAVLSQFISGNALPGIVLGIIAGSVANSVGYKDYKTWIIIILISLLFVSIFYFRNVDPDTWWFKNNTWDKWLDLKQLK